MDVDGRKYRTYGPEHRWILTLAHHQTSALLYVPGVMKSIWLLLTGSNYKAIIPKQGSQASSKSARRARLFIKLPLENEEINSSINRRSLFSLGIKIRSQADSCTWPCWLLVSSHACPTFSPPRTLAVSASLRSLRTLVACFDSTVLFN